MLEISLLLVALFSLVALTRWEHGMYLAVLMAFLQDPLRKLIEGQPPYFILLVAVVFGAAVFGASASRVPLSPNAIIGWRRFMHVPFQLYVGIVLIQAVHSLLRFGNPMVPVLGLINYLTPFIALVFVYSFAARGGIRRVRALFGFYLVCAMTALSTLYLQLAGFDWQVLGEVGSGIQIHGYGTILTAYCGTFRASEIAAWHAATCACFTILLLSERKVTLGRLIVAAAIVAVLVSLGILTGRRKMLVMVAIFVCAYVALLAVFLRGARGPALAAAFIGMLVYVGGVFSFEAEPGEFVDRSAEYSLHIARSRDVFGDVPDRFTELGLAPIMWAYDWFGFFGGGLGIGTQGVQHLANLGDHIGAAEGGLGKLTLELGIPGVFIVLMLGVALLRHIWSILHDVSRHSAPITRLACGLVAFLIANAASFSVATQTYGDVFVLLFLGSALGTLLATPLMIAPQIVPRYYSRPRLQPLHLRS